MEERIKEMQFRLDETEAEKAKAEEDLAASEKSGSDSDMIDARIDL